LAARQSDSGIFFAPVSTLIISVGTDITVDAGYQRLPLKRKAFFFEKKKQKTFMS
jgi:hypothetical protein